MAFFFRNDWTKLKVQSVLEKKQEKEKLAKAKAAGKSSFSFQINVLYRVLTKTLYTITVDTPDIRALFNTLVTYKKETNENIETPSTMTMDDMSSIASGVLHDEQLQLDTALRNSMKNTFEKSEFTPDGSHINELRAKRKLVRESDRITLSDRKRAAIDYDFSKDPDSPPHIDQKARNRLNNNGLDAAYFMATQSSIPSPQNSASSTRTTAKGSKWIKSIRIEAMRHMSSSDEIKASKGRDLYRLLTRKHPSDQYGDILSIANDSDEIGMTVQDTVNLMLSMM